MALNYQQLAKKMVARAKKSGSSQAEVFIQVGREASCRVRDGEIESLVEATSRGVGIRVIVDKRLGFAWSNDFTPSTIDAFVDRAILLARASAPNPLNGFAESKDLGMPTDVGSLCDPDIVNLAPDWKIKAALEMEKVCRAYDPRIKTVDSIDASESVTEVYLASSAGMHGGYQTTSVSLYAAVVAAEGEQLQTGYCYDAKRFLKELQSPEFVAREGARKAVRLLGAKKVKSQRVPVVFDPIMAAAFIRSVTGAMSGDAVFKKSSFLASKLGQPIASATVTIIDDGTLPKGLGTAPFDGEGIPTRKNSLVENGVLQRFLYDSFTARKAKARSTGNASRSFKSMPSINVRNLYLEPGTKLAEDIVREIPNGFYVTAMLGQGANIVTGQYSRGANGVWIENGELTHAVQEVTVAGSLTEMLHGIDAIGSDLHFHGSTGAPTIRFKELTISGE